MAETSATNIGKLTVTNVTDREDGGANIEELRVK